VFSEKDILKELLAKMRQSDTSETMQDKHDAIEFFMEVCQMSKNMQMGARYSAFETIHSLSLIEILAETFNMYYPSEQTLRHEAFREQEQLVEYLMHSHATSEQSFQPMEVVRGGIVDFLKPHEKYDICKIDLLKINAIDVLMNITTQFSNTAAIRIFALSEN
jgi:hypothetical protein